MPLCLVYLVMRRSDILAPCGKPAVILRFCLLPQSFVFLALPIPAIYDFTEHGLLGSIVECMERFGVHFYNGDFNFGLGGGGGEGD